MSVVEDKLFKGSDFYYMDADNDGYKILNINIPAAAKFYPTIWSYGRYLPRALVDDKFIYFIGDRYNAKLDHKTALTTKVVKQLGTFYLFNNSLFDGSKTYPIKADYETLDYLGSFVQVINACAGDMPNTPQVEVVYHHFFKDKSSVYYFNNKISKWQIIQTASEADYKPDNYEALQTLYKIKDVKGTVKKKSNQQLNYYLIAGGCLVLIIMGLLLFKKNKR